MRVAGGAREGQPTFFEVALVAPADRTGGGDRPPLRVLEESIDSPPGVISALTVGHAVRQSAHFGQDLSSSCHRARFDVNLRRQA